jgi:hypothetical protein
MKQKSPFSILLERALPASPTRFSRIYWTVGPRPQAEYQIGARFKSAPQLRSMSITIEET